MSDDKRGLVDPVVVVPVTGAHDGPVVTNTRAEGDRHIVSGPLDATDVDAAATQARERYVLDR